MCQGRTLLRKLPLVIHVKPAYTVALNKTCRFCPTCDLLIAHQDEVEGQLVAIFAERQPEMIGNEYLVIGTLERLDWKRGTKEALTPAEMVEGLHDFKEVRKIKPAARWSQEPKRKSKPAREKPEKGTPR
jgi:hypothetical protein